MRVLFILLGLISNYAFCNPIDEIETRWRGLGVKALEKSIILNRKTNRSADEDCLHEEDKVGAFVYIYDLRKGLSPFIVQAQVMIRLSTLKAQNVFMR